MLYRVGQIASIFFATLLPSLLHAQSRPDVPRVWVDADMHSLELPLAHAPATPKHVPAEYYYRMPVRRIYRSYPVYAPDRAPTGYLQWLESREPEEITFDPATLKTEQDWIRAGEVVFDAPVTYDRQVTPADLQTPEWWRAVQIQTLQDGTVPYLRYVVRQKGKVEVGSLSCASCHTRVMPDGTVLKGAQGNFPFDRAIGFGIPQFPAAVLPRFIFATYGVPWLKDEPAGQIAQIPADRIADAFNAIPPGVSARVGTSFLYPVQVPDLIGVKDRRYLDRTGLQQHRSIVDLMRYAALNQDTLSLARYGDFCPGCPPAGPAAGQLPDPSVRGRYSDEQLYALAVYVYSRQPPPNPHRLNAEAKRGQKVFAREGCGGCHTPPLYTNNKLTPAAGFKVPEEHRTKYDILNVVVGTDPGLALKTRRGTGYYKVPSLKGVWYRGPFEHSGSVATLEDWFDPRRLQNDYTPTGFRGFGVQKRAVKGHEFGLKLNAKDKAALIAFLKTL
jgi:hypothetical protein